MAANMRKYWLYNFTQFLNIKLNNVLLALLIAFTLIELVTAHMKKKVRVGKKDVIEFFW